MREIKPSNKEIVKKISLVIEQNYVYPEIGLKMISHLESKLDNGSLDEFKGIQSIAEGITNILYEIREDKHLKLLFREPKTAPYFEIHKKMQSAGMDIKRISKIPRGKSIAKDTQPVRRVISASPVIGGESGIIETRLIDSTIGYIKLSMLKSAVGGEKEKMIEALNSFSQCKALIFDLTKCRGGDASMVHLLQNFVFGALEDEEPILLTETYFRPQDVTFKNYTEVYTEGGSFREKPVFVLVSKHTGSAAESFAFSLKNHGRAKLVGRTTAGAGHPTSFHHISEDLLFSCSIGVTYNPKTNIGWDLTGVTPDIDVDSESALNEAVRLIKLESIN